MELSPEQYKRILPIPVTVITTVGRDGGTNAAPYGCVMPVLRQLDLIAVASAPSRDTLRNIRETGEFVVNIIGMPSFERAMKTAKNYPPEVSELEEEGIATTPSCKVAPPRIEDALGWIEAVLDREVTGDSYALLVGKVLCAEMNDRYVKDGGLTEPPAVMLNLEYRLVGESVGNVRDTMRLFLGDSPEGG